MGDHRNIRSTYKISSPSKETQKWNIPPESSGSTSTTNKGSNSKSDFSLKKSSAFESLFDSGYNSTTVSKSSIDLENEFDSKLTISSSNCEEFVSKAEPSKWTDSGVCIADSGLNIDNNDSINDDYINEQLTKQNDELIAIKSKLLYEAYNPDQDGDTLLHLAIIQELEEIVYKLIQIVPHPDFLDIFNHLSQTPLHLATLTRQPNIVRRLIISGATIDLRDRHGNTALHVACAQSDFDSVQAIISPIHEREIRAADVVNYPIDVQRLPNDLLKLRNYEGETCIHLAAYNTNKNIIELLVKCGADVNAQEGKSGKGILHWAVEMRNLDLIKFLVKRCNADVNLRSYAGHTPLHLAWSLLTHNNNKMKAIVKYLIDCGGEPSLPPNDSDSDIDSLSDDE